MLWAGRFGPCYGSIPVGQSLWVSLLVSRCVSVAVGWSRVSRCGLVSLGRLLWVGRYSQLPCVGCCGPVVVGGLL